MGDTSLRLVDSVSSKSNYTRGVKAEAACEADDGAVSKSAK